MKDIKQHTTIPHGYKWKILNKILATVYKHDNITMWGLSQDCWIALIRKHISVSQYVCMHAQCFSHI